MHNSGSAADGNREHSQPTSLFSGYRFVIPRTLHESSCSSGSSSSGRRRSGDGDGGGGDPLIAHLDDVGRQIEECGGTVVERGEETGEAYYITTRVLGHVPQRKQINPMWVKDCIQASKLLDADLYRPQDMLFYGKKFTTTNMSRPRQELVVSIITVYGGEYTSSLLPDTTHLIYNSDLARKESKKLTVARKRDSVIILSDHEFIDMIAELYRKHLEFHAKARDIFKGLKFYIFHSDEGVISALKSHIEFGSGTIVSKPDKDALIVCQYRTTSKNLKQFVTAQWVEDCINKKKLVPVDENKYLYRSAPLLSSEKGGERRSEWCISLTGFEDRVRFDLQYLITTMGAKHTGQFSRSKNSHLIFKKPTGLKYEKAKEWKIETQDEEWLRQRFALWYDAEEKKIEVRDAEKSRKRPLEGEQNGTPDRHNEKRRKLKHGDEVSAMEEQKEEQPAHAFFLDNTTIGEDTINRLSTMVESLHGKIVQDPYKEVIDILVTDRAPTLGSLSMMVIANCGYIVTSEYLKQSSSAGKWLDPERFEYERDQDNELLHSECLRQWRSRRKSTGHKPFHGFAIVSILPSKDDSASMERQVVSVGGGQWISKVIHCPLNEISFAIADTKSSKKKMQQMEGLKLKVLDRRYLQAYITSMGEADTENYVMKIS